MPEYLFKPTIGNIVTILESLADEHDIEKRDDLSHDDVHIWNGHLRERSDSFFGSVPVKIIYNPSDEYPLHVDTPGPYLASQIPHLRMFLEEYRHRICSEKICSSCWMR
jgi:hypothetical protein